MKVIRKLLTGILAVAMVMTMGMTVFASGSGITGSITIGNAEVGQTYSIYRIFDFTPSGADYKSGTYILDSAWSGFSADTYFTKDSNGYITSKLDSSNIAAFAALASDYAAKNKIPATATGKATTKSLTFSSLPLGYYLSDSSLGAICSLDTTTPDATIEEKNDVPHIDKAVHEDSDADNVYGATNDAEIGQTVTYQSTISMKKGAEDYAMHDSMSAGLTFTGISSVVADGATLANNTDYTVSAPASDSDSFDLAFSDAYLQSVRTAGKDVAIIVTYTATLNGSAVIASTGNMNKVYLVYNNGVKTEEHSTTTYTYSFNLFKYATGDTTNTLAGAHFNLYGGTGYSYSSTNTAATNVTNNAAYLLKLVKISDNEYRLATPSDADTTTVTEIVTTTGTSGIVIKGLDADTYHLIEAQAPVGYNLLSNDIAVQLSRTGNANGAVTITSTSSNAQADGQKIKVENKTGALLPHTGGIGTTIFYLIGGIMILGAFVTFIVRRKMSANK